MGSHQPIRKMVVPGPVAIPDKLYFRIGDVAKLCAVAPYVLRFWETEFAQLKPNKGGTGQRLYRKKDVEMALRIKALLYEQGFTIPGARQVLKGEPAVAGAIAVSQRGAEVEEPKPAASGAAEGYDRGAELRLRAQLADIRDEMHSLLGRLNLPIGRQADVPAVAAASTPKPARPRLVLEPKPAPQPAALHLAQRDLFAAE